MPSKAIRKATYNAEKDLYLLSFRFRLRFALPWKSVVIGLRAFSQSNRECARVNDVANKCATTMLRRRQRSWQRQSCTPSRMPSRTQRGALETKCSAGNVEKARTKLHSRMQSRMQSRSQSRMHSFARFTFDAPSIYDAVLVSCLLFAGTGPVFFTCFLRTRFSQFRLLSFLERSNFRPLLLERKNGSQ